MTLKQSFTKTVQQKFPNWDFERLEKIDDSYNGLSFDERIIESLYFLLCNKKGYYSVQNRLGEESGRYKYLRDAKYWASYDSHNVIVKIGSMDVEAEIKDLLTEIWE